MRWVILLERYVINRENNSDQDYRGMFPLVGTVIGNVVWIRLEGVIPLIGMVISLEGVTPFGKCSNLFRLE